MLEKTIIYLSYITILFMTFIMLKTNRNWASAPGFFLLLWSIYIGLPLILAPYFYVSGAAMLWLTAMAAFWFFGSIIGHSVRIKVNCNLAADEMKLLGRFSGYNSVTAIIIFSSMGALAVLLSIVSGGVSLKSILNIANLQELARSNASARYQESGGPAMLVNLLLSFNYAGCIISGMYLCSKKNIGIVTKGSWLIAIFPVLTLLIFGIVQNAKANLLYALCMWIAGFLTIYAWNERSIFSAFGIKKFLYSVISMAFIVYIFYWMQSTRYSNTDFTMNLAYSVFERYAFGHLGGFCFWFDNIYDENQQIDLGSNSFAGLYEIIGLSEKSNRPEQIPKYLFNQIQTNVDTIFSDLIKDFGIFGSLFFMLLVGFFVSFFSRISMRRNCWSITILPIFYSIALWSFVNNLLNYTTIWIAFFIFFIFTILINLRFKVR